MRFKFFLTIFFAMSATAISVSAIHYHFFRVERLRLIELNLLQNATLLQKTNLDLTKKEFLHKGNEIVEKVIGDDKINIIIGIYSETGSILYKNENALIFNLPDVITPEFEEWEDVETKEYFIKYYTSYDEDQNRFLKVGMILNKSLVRWKYLNQRIFMFVILILIVVSIISYILTIILLKPVRLISKDIQLMASRIDKGEFQEPKFWFSGRSKRESFFKDELFNLVTSLDLLAERLSMNQLQMQKWAALMAHELKTPMTRLKNAVEGFTIHKDSKYLASLETELATLETVVMDFLEWASFENDQETPILHAVSLKKRLQKLIDVFKEEHKDFNFSLELNDIQDVKIFCNPLHFDQLVSNIVSNSVKYSEHKFISVTVSGNELEIADTGKGIPQIVLDNLGKPFNRYSTKGLSGHGLGLAWIKTICRKYDWDLKIKNELGAKFIITFPGDPA